jgi:hypothetical protein
LSEIAWKSQQKAKAENTHEHVVGKKLNGKTIYHGTKMEKRREKMLKAMNCRNGYKQQPEPNPTDTKNVAFFSR